MKRTLVVVPALDEARNIGALVAEVLGLADAPDLLVVDDGSSDDTARAAAEAGARVVRLPFNCGIGAAVQTGLRVGLDEGYEFLARLDGDGQHAPSVLPELLAPLEAGSADFAIGSRYLKGEGFQSTAIRRLGIRWFAWMLRAACDLRVTDPTSGCWAASRRAAEVLCAEYASDYPEVDSLVHLARNGLPIVEVPVAMRARAAGRSSIAGTRVLYYMGKVTIALLVSRLRSPR